MTGGRQWVLNFDRGAGAAASGWRVLEKKNYIIVYVKKKNNKKTPEKQRVDVVECELQKILL